MLTATIDKLLGRKEVDNAPDKDMVNAVIKGAKAQGIVLENVRHALSAQHVFGVATTVKWSSVIVVWESSLDSRILSRVGVGYCQPEEHLACIVDWSDKWRPKRDTFNEAYFSTVIDTLRTTSMSLKAQRAQPIDEGTIHTELIKGLKAEYLLPSSIMRAVAHIDTRRRDIIRESRSDPLSVHDLRTAMLMTLPSLSTKDSINAVALRSPLIHRRCQELTQ